MCRITSRGWVFLANRVTKIPVQLRRFRFLAPSSPLPADLKAPKLPVPVIASAPCLCFELAGRGLRCVECWVWLRRIDRFTALSHAGLDLIYTTGSPFIHLYYCFPKHLPHSSPCLVVLWLFAQGCPIGVPKNPEISGSSRKNSLGPAKEVHSARKIQQV